MLLPSSRTVYWIRLVLITTAQTAQALPLPRSACALLRMRRSSLLASRRRTCSRRLSPGGMLHPTRYDCASEGGAEGIFTSKRWRHVSHHRVTVRPG
jgi:hypothetical protein